MIGTHDSDGGMSSGGPESGVLRAQQLFVKHQGVLKAFILSLQPGFVEADDVLQETFLVVTRKANDFREGTNFLAWACSIARFKLLEMRRRATSPMLTEEAMNVLAENAPDESFFEKRLPILRNCIGRLAPRARQVVALRYHSELGLQEIADQLAWKEPAVRVALSKARAVLRECVQSELKREAV